MTAPEFLPVLSAGSHSSPKAGACVMEYVSLLAGEPWSDSPSCTHPVLAAAARRVNDRLPDDQRQQLVPLIGRLFGTDYECKVLSVRLAVWSARQVLPLVPEQDRAVCTTAIDVAAAWCDGRATEQECRAAVDASYAAYAAYDAAAYAAAAAAYAAASAASAASAAASDAVDDAYDAAAYAAASAVDAAVDAAAAAAVRVSFLTGLLDEYDRTTGRTATPLTTEQYASLAGAGR